MEHNEGSDNGNRKYTGQLEHRVNRHQRVKHLDLRKVSTRIVVCFCALTVAVFHSLVAKPP